VAAAPGADRVAKSARVHGLIGIAEVDRLLVEQRSAAIASDEGGGWMTTKEWSAAWGLGRVATHARLLGLVAAGVFEEGTKHIRRGAFGFYPTPAYRQITTTKGGPK